MVKKSLRKYIITYQSEEHYEVLGYVEAESIDDAVKRAKEELKTEAKFYEVGKAKIAEIIGEEKIIFDIK